MNANPGRLSTATPSFQRKVLRILPSRSSGPRTAQIGDRRLGIYRPEVIRQGCAHGAPHLHDLRRAFAVHRLMRWYREGADVDAKLPLLATYMGHGHFGYTKTYLTLTQELLREAGSRFACGFDRLDWLTHDSDI